jgi:hypothetical protein
LGLLVLVETMVPAAGLVSPGCQTLEMERMTGLEPSRAGSDSEEETVSMP